MSTSRHPVAYRLEQLVDGPTRLLATVMALPLIDGIFPALVLAGAVSGVAGILETGLLIFGGSATMAVILAEMDGTPREHVTAILTLAVILLPLAALEAALAQTIESMLNLQVFKRFAALVIMAVAAKTASAEIGEVLPSPGAIIGLGLLASVAPGGAELVINANLIVMLSAAAAAGVGVAFALGVAVAGPRLRGRVDIDRFRFGSAVALGVLGLSVLEIGLIGTEHPVALGVLLVTAVFSYDPSGESDPRADDDPSGTDADDDPSGTDADDDPSETDADEAGADDTGDAPADEPAERPPADSPGDGWDSDPGTPSAPEVVADTVSGAFDAADTRVVADGNGSARAVSARESWGTVAPADGGAGVQADAATAEDSLGAFGSGDAGVDTTADRDGVDAEAAEVDADDGSVVDVDDGSEVDTDDDSEVDTDDGARAPWL